MQQQEDELRLRQHERALENERKKAEEEEEERRMKRLKDKLCEKLLSIVGLSFFLLE